MTDVTQYKPGSKITLEHPDGSVLKGREVNSVYAIKAGKRLDYIQSFLDEGWIVTKHEPAVELPTEPGWYETVEEDWDLPSVLFLHENGRWYNPGAAEPTVPPPPGASLTRLRPVDEVRRETAAEVIDWLVSDIDMAEAAGLSGQESLASAREHFGLVSE